MIKMVNANQTETVKIEKTRGNGKINLPLRSECVIKLLVKKDCYQLGSQANTKFKSGFLWQGHSQSDRRLWGN
jgi:hypothetical protein